MKHPLSTLTNLSYSIAALWLLYGGAGPLEALVAATLFLLTVSSAMYHALDSYFWQKADIVSIYAVFNSLFVLQLSHWVGFSSYLVWVALALSVLMGITHKRWTHAVIGLLGVQNLILLSLRDVELFGWATVLFLSALYISSEADEHAKGNPYYDVPHAIWHVLTAIAILLTAL